MEFSRSAITKSGQWLCRTDSECLAPGALLPGLDANTKVDKHGFSSLELAPIKLSHRILSLPGRLPMTPPATESCVPTPKAPV
jgi:hypothetical protein